jgi:hypothetical protein
MITTPVKSWNACKTRISKVFAGIKIQRTNSGVGHVSPPVFRGQANTDWHLETTLEREYQPPLHWSRYDKKVLDSSLRVLSGMTDIEAPRNQQSLADALMVDSIPRYEQLARLRHHGFPTPLLDWSRSPFVAAYFAFSPISVLHADAVSIFVFREYCGSCKGASDGVHVSVHGRWASIHERHVRQQSVYTIAYEDVLSETGVIKDIKFLPHEEALSRIHSNYPEQDRLEKIVVPAGCREEAMLDLERMNITEFSLFGTEDALVRTVARFALQTPRIE